MTLRLADIWLHATSKCVAGRGDAHRSDSCGRVTRASAVGRQDDTEISSKSGLPTYTKYSASCHSYYSIGKSPKANGFRPCPLFFIPTKFSPFPINSLLSYHIQHYLLLSPVKTRISFLIHSKFSFFRSAVSTDGAPD